MPSLEEYLDANRTRHEDELCELLRIASVSADSRHKDDVRRAADWVAGQFRALDFATELIPTAGHPIVFAQSAVVPNAPTVLVYGHYDVQPPDPLGEWITPPFEPTRRDGNLYARGATDDKGQMLTHVKSAEAWIKTAGKLPLNLKFLIEGEEEVGSDKCLRVPRKANEEAGVRRGRHQRLQPVRPRPAGDHLRAEGSGLLRAAADRPEARPALRHVRRRGDESGQCAGEDARCVAR